MLGSTLKVAIKMRIILIISVILMFPFCANAADQDEMTVTRPLSHKPLSHFVGDYTIIGKTPLTGKLYTGKVTLKKENNQLIMIRQVENEPPLTLKTYFKKPFEGATMLMADWPEPSELSIACLDTIDLDNDLRLTCLWAKKGSIHSDKLGLEAMFPLKIDGAL